MIYSDVTYIDTYSEQVANYKWPVSADTPVQLTIAADYSDIDTEFTYGNLVGKLYQNRYLRINKEYVKIISFTTSTITVERAQLGSIAVAGTTGLRAAQQDGVKIWISKRASILIQQYHQIKKDSEGNLFGAEEYQDVTAELALYLLRILPIEKIRERVSVLTDGEYSDKNMTLDPVGGFTMPEEIAFQIDEITEELGGDVGIMQRS